MNGIKKKMPCQIPHAVALNPIDLGVQNKKNLRNL